MKLARHAKNAYWVTEGNNTKVQRQPVRFYLHTLSLAGAHVQDARSPMGAAALLPSDWVSPAYEALVLWVRTAGNLTESLR